MRSDYDELFDLLYNDEVKKIPLIFRLGLRRNKYVYGFMGVLVIAVCILSTLFYMTETSESMSTLPGYTTIAINNYDYRYLIALIIVAAVLILIGLWILSEMFFDQRAFAKATRTASRLSMQKRHLEAVRRQDWKMKNWID
ncbi:MAG: hypothetical protein K5745_01820 [Saccharofermentans sp.]|nr:hypothetical protein [Saccharofermentans sp.]